MEQQQQKTPTDGTELKNLQEVFTREYNEIIQDDRNRSYQWSGQGDTFVKFSLYKEEETIALPYTNIQG